MRQKQTSLENKGSFKYVLAAFNIIYCDDSLLVTTQKHSGNGCDISHLHHGLQRTRGCLTSWPNECLTKCCTNVCNGKMQNGAIQHPSLQRMTENNNPGGSGHLFEVAREELQTRQLAA